MTDSSERDMSMEAVSRAEEALYEQAMLLFKLGYRLEARAILDGVTLEYGSLSPQAQGLRKQCIKGMQRELPPASTYPSPNASPSGSPCPICDTTMVTHEQLLGKTWLLCPECALLMAHTSSKQLKQLDKGEPSGAKQCPTSLVHRREYTFCRRFIDGLGAKNVLNYGVGWSLVPEALRARGIDAVGCDLWRPLIEQRKKMGRENNYFHRDDLPDRRFSLLSAFEVFEHFTNPLKDMRVLADHLNDPGPIVGSSDFWHGGSLAHHPSQDLSYWKHGTHITAWTWKSMITAAQKLGLHVQFFRGDCAEHSAKCFFVFYKGNKVANYLKTLPKVLPDVYGMTIEFDGEVSTNSETSEPMQMAR